MKTNFTVDEEECILNKIIEQKKYYTLRDDESFWRNLSKDGNFRNRPWTSLKTHFLRHIFPNIRKYNISELERRKIQVAMIQTDPNDRISDDSIEFDY
ncbi:unnamed protein product [Phyllotreta striolata]|uniref:TERF2-interacting telomeric protein 1 n=1 Tax=Phyllotreta striolata TaxID=444603 RepID=A0A9N9TVL6_PHYSR|nr:unnamed protein product [Phyllotreta striolata]